MAHRYLEIIIPTRQFVLLIVVVVGLIAGAFLLGVTVRLAEPPSVAPVAAAAATLPQYEPAPVPASSTVGAGVPEPVVSTAPVEPSPVEVVAQSPLTSPPQAGAGAEVESTPAAAWPTPVPTARAVPPTRPPEVEPTVAPPKPTAVAAEPTARPGSKSLPWVQVAAVSREDTAREAQQRLVRMGFKSGQVVVQKDARGLYHVRLGPFLDAESASRVVARLRESGYKDAFLVKE